MKKKEKETNYMTIGIALGLLAGCCFGITMHNIAYGVVIGLCFGIAFGAALVENNKKKNNKGKDENEKL